jgi:hypothetical protein
MRLGSVNKIREVLEYGAMLLQQLHFEALKQMRSMRADPKSTVVISVNVRRGR